VDLLPECQTYLDVSYTMGAITDASMSLIARRLSSLTHLDVSDTHEAITDASMLLFLNDVLQVMR
jgi:hypothetical protein